jgi:flagellar motor switch protein FliN/FliY
MAAAFEAEEAAVAVNQGGMTPDLPDFGGQSEPRRPAHDIDLLHDVNLRVKIELGRTRMLVDDVLRLGDGSVVELDKLAGDPVDVFANDRLIARGEVLVLNDNFCVRISEVVSGAPREAAAL